MNRSLLTFGFSLALAAFSLPVGATLVFNYDAEYTTEPTTLALANDAANLNSADSQVGLWSDMVAPVGAGSQNPNSIFQFEDNPDQAGRVLQVDRPAANTSFSANMTSPVLVGGSIVNISVGNRRTVTGSTNKDWEIIGLDGDSKESFHLRINTQNTSGERLGTITNGGVDYDFDLATKWGMSSGTDAAQDLDNIGGAPFDTNEIGALTLALGDTSYTVDFKRQDGTAVYTTNAIPYNDTGGGLATQLVKIQFNLNGDADSSTLNSGFVIDNFNVNGTLVPEPSAFMLALVSLGVAGFAGRNRRRKRHPAVRS